jgi:uncharacterized protein (DUF433 family)
MQYGPINVDPEIMSGVPVFAGTRVPVQNLFDYIEVAKICQSFWTTSRRLQEKALWLF